MRLRSAAKAAATAFVLGLVLLLPFTATPLGNQLAADYPFPFAWLGWISRDALDGGDLAYVAGVVIGHKGALVDPKLVKGMAG